MGFLYNFGMMLIFMSDLHAFSQIPIQKIDPIMAQRDTPYKTLSNDMSYMTQLFEEKFKNFRFENNKRRVSK